MTVWGKTVRKHQKRQLLFKTVKVKRSLKWLCCSRIPREYLGVIGCGLEFMGTLKETRRSMFRADTGISRDISFLWMCYTSSTKKSRVSLNIARIQHKIGRRPLKSKKASLSAPWIRIKRSVRRKRISQAVLRWTAGILRGCESASAGSSGKQGGAVAGTTGKLRGTWTEGRLSYGTGEKRNSSKRGKAAKLNMPRSNRAD